MPDMQQLGNMKLAIEHCLGMMRDQHVLRFNKTTLSEDHCRIDVTWVPGPTDKHLPSDLLMYLEAYECKGYRAYTADTNNLTSTIRIAKGKLSPLEHCKLMLESRSLSSYSYDPVSGNASLEFVLGTGPESNIEIMAFLSKIKDYKIHSHENGFGIKIKGMDTLGPQDWALNNYGSPADVARKYAINEEIENHLIRTGQTVAAKLYPTCDTGIKMEDSIGCKECKGTQIYQPLIGPAERCKTCQ